MIRTTTTAGMIHLAGDAAVAALALRFASPAVAVDPGAVEAVPMELVLAVPVPTDPVPGDPVLEAVSLPVE
ncbi:hypothetical protein JL101_006145 [Skermanella rosea]|uniref:hypothetical protein n=1 Tax=Skermanella rosea TaxID=1817965 RepID=UPI001931FB0C|nr:hypothetical protein [Skermanella rosea]UEM05018.1 hypothetical protein JL101_006145 [Skermanella rosea]